MTGWQLWEGSDSFAPLVPASSIPCLTLLSPEAFTLSSHTASFQAGSGKAEVIDFIFIFHFYSIFNLSTNVYILLYLFPPNLITAQQNVIALCLLLQSVPPPKR